MTDPKMILFDEISLGLSPIVTLKIYETIKKIRSEGVTILLVEQNVRQSLAVANRAYVLKAGRIVLSGETKDLRDEEEVRKAYFGT
jgi:branched-chain amino acid transport system ATP-binding protein